MVSIHDKPKRIKSSLDELLGAFAPVTCKPSTNGFHDEQRTALEQAVKDAATPIIPRDVDPLSEERGRTDAANAKRLVKKFGHNLRFAAEWKTWLVWNGQQWKRETGPELQGMAKQTARCLWDEIKDVENTDTPYAATVYADLVRKMTRWAIHSNGASGVANSVTLAESEPAIPVDVASLDVDPFLLNVANGTINLKMGVLRKHSQQDLITKLCPTEYDSDADCPRWRVFLKEIFDDDAALIAYLQRLLGYGLTGDVREQLMVILFGEGANGKSTLVDAVQHVIGTDFADTVPSSLLIASKYGHHPSERTTLIGKRMAFCSETESGALLSEATIKELTGESRIAVKWLYKEYGSYPATHKIFLSTNHKPEVLGDDFAIWRRLKLIPFNRQFKGKKADTGLLNKLKAEAKGILAWMVQGCLDWQRNGMNEPQSVLLAIKEYKKEQDQVGQFIETYCVKGETFRVRSSALFECFQDKTPNAGLNPTSFAARLKKHGFKNRPGDIDCKRNVMIWHGMKLK